MDYKHGRPKSVDDGYEPWPADRVQLAVQALVLRANGYRCDEGVIYYAKSRQRVRVAFDDAVMAEAARDRQCLERCRLRSIAVTAGRLTKMSGMFSRGNLPSR